MSLAGRIHLPGTSVTGLPEMINLSLPATSDQECRLPGAGGTSCPPALRQPETAKTWPTLLPAPPLGPRLGLQGCPDKGHLSFWDSFN